MIIFSSVAIILVSSVAIILVASVAIILVASVAIILVSSVTIGLAISLAMLAATIAAAVDGCAEPRLDDVRGIAVRAHGQQDLARLFEKDAQLKGRCAAQKLFDDHAAIVVARQAKLFALQLEKDVLEKGRAVLCILKGAPIEDALGLFKVRDQLIHLRRRDGAMDGRVMDDQGDEGASSLAKAHPGTFWQRLILAPFGKGSYLGTLYSLTRATLWHGCVADGPIRASQHTRPFTLWPQ